MKKKLKDSTGLTLIEMLCVIPILLLLCLMVGTGFNMAMNSLRDSTAQSETQLLLSSLSNALTDKLRYCVVTYTVDDDTALITYNLSIGAVGLTDDTDGDDVPEGMVKVGGKKLLFDGAYGTDTADGTRYKVVQADVNPAIAGRWPVFTVKLKVQGASAATSGIEAGTEFTVRCLNPIKKEATTP